MTVGLWVCYLSLRTSGDLFRTAPTACDAEVGNKKKTNNHEFSLQPTPLVVHCIVSDFGVWHLKVLLVIKVSAMSGFKSSSFPDDMPRSDSTLHITGRRNFERKGNVTSSEERKWNNLFICKVHHLSLDATSLSYFDCSDCYKNMNRYFTA